MAKSLRSPPPKPSASPHGIELGPGGHPVPALKGHRRSIPAGVLRREDAAAFYGVSPATLDRLNASGAIPAPVRLGGVLCWNAAELQAHMDHSGPPREEWAAVWQQIVRTRR